MKIIGKRKTGETAVYEVVGFRFYVNEDGRTSINCKITDATSLEITGKDFDITHEQSEKYSRKIFETDCLDLLDEPVQMDLVTSNIGVAINATGYSIGLPIYVAGISGEFISNNGRIMVADSSR